MTWKLTPLIGALCSTGIASAGALAQAPGRASPKLELVEVSGSVEKPDGGDAMAYTIRIPRGAKPSPDLLKHNRGYTVDIDATSRLTVSVWRLAGEGNLDSTIAYKANTYGGLASKQETEKGTYLVVLNPMGPLQTVFLFKKIQGGHMEVECDGPPSHVETLKEACGSFRTK